MASSRQRMQPEGWPQKRLDLITNGPLAIFYYGYLKHRYM